MRAACRPMPLVPPVITITFSVTTNLLSDQTEVFLSITQNAAAENRKEHATEHNNNKKIAQKNNF
jgi:hypothetical protein